jgi:hypothetical protein
MNSGHETAKLQVRFKKLELVSALEPEATRRVLATVFPENLLPYSRNGKQGFE